jgi:hypothetical protein
MFQFMVRSPAVRRVESTLPRPAGASSTREAAADHGPRLKPDLKNS